MKLVAFRTQHTDPSVVEVVDVPKSAAKAKVKELFNKTHNRILAKSGDKLVILEKFVDTTTRATSHKLTFTKTALKYHPLQHLL